MPGNDRVGRLSRRGGFVDSKYRARTKCVEWDVLAKVPSFRIRNGTSKHLIDNEPPSSCRRAGVTTYMPP
jgi:hypothetical protein